LPICVSDFAAAFWAWPSATRWVVGSRRSQRGLAEALCANGQVVEEWLCQSFVVLQVRHQDGQRRRLFSLTQANRH
jgi:hypothetical protein